MNAGEVLFPRGGLLIHWIRFLNVFLAAGLVWIAYVAASSLFPENRFVRIGVPLLVAFMPQAAFYSIENDVLSPLCFGLVFINLAHFLGMEIPSIRRALLTGLTLAAACLLKSSNLPLLVVAVAMLVFKARRLTNRYQSMAGAPPLARKQLLVGGATSLGLCLLCACGPVLIWFLWNLSNFGDLTGDSVKIQILGWTYKPFLAWFTHPIFRPHGAYTFWSELMASFWRGELIWSGKLLARPFIDVFYWVSSTLFIGVAVASLISRFGRPGRWQTRMLWFGFWSFASQVIFLGLLSVPFDFGSCVNPSPQHPFFVSGRLIFGSAIPFALLYVYGLDWTLTRAKSERLRFPLLIAIVLFITVSEAIVNQVAFSSKFNWFHMLHGGS